MGYIGSFPTNTTAVIGIPIGKLNDLAAKVAYLLTNPFGGGGSGYQQPTSGALNQATFTWATAPKVIVIDGVPTQRVATNGIVNWTGTTTTILQQTWPTQDIFACA